LLTRFTICSTITLISALVSLGFSIAAVMNHTGEARTMALYASARSFAFTIVSAVPFLTGSVAWLEASAVGMIVVQLCDAGIGIITRDRTKTFGPAATAIVNFVALLWLLT
jgi:hypothetical protein